jgi:DNA-binding transcriptional ArsR family regulator
MLILDNISLAPPVRVRSLAGVECCLALWTASAPEREPLRKTASLVQAAMPKQTMRILDGLNRTLAGWPLWTTNAFLRLGSESLDDALAGLAVEPPRRVAADLLLGFLDDREQVFEYPPGVDPLTAVLASELLPADGIRRVTRLVRHPERTVMEIRGVLEAFCQAGFTRIWSKQRSVTERTVAALTARTSNASLSALASMSPRAVGDWKRDRLIFLGGQDTTVVSCQRLGALEIMPSLWLRRRVALARTPEIIGLSLNCYPTARNEHKEPGHLMDTLKAMGNERRLEIVRLCVERPRTTPELASTVGLTEAPTSRHLKALERAGLVVGERVGPHVTYSTVIETLHFLGENLQQIPEQMTEQSNLVHASAT